MKHKKFSMKWKLFIYMLSFTTILLVILWLFQIIYLQKFYKYIKTNELNNAANELLSLINNDDLQYIAENIAYEYDLSIIITDTDNNIMYSSEYSQNSSIHGMSREEFEQYYKRIQENGGSLTVEFDGMKNLTIPELSRKDKFNNQRSPDKNNNYPTDEFRSYYNEPNTNAGENAKYGIQLRQQKMESVILFEITKIDGQDCIVMLNCVLTPVDATVNTLKIQLIVISVIMVILSLIIAFVMSKNISKPIIKINDSAKELAKGKFDIIFAGNGYLEASELSDTLNYATSELSKTENFQHELLANVSHDLRTPLTMIIAYSEIMRDIPGENSPENVQIIIDESKRLTNLVNDMLDISKLQAGVLELNLGIYNLTSSIKTVLKRYNKLVEQDGYIINFNYNEEVFINADEYKIYQVIYNLVNNAINYTSNDKTVIINQKTDSNKVLIEVIDTGMGISAENLPYVWERYYKVDKTHKRSVAGTGLGLSIVKNILELHNAEYGVNSLEGKGSIFWFKLELDDE